jgi:hypothetical protein
LLGFSGVTKIRSVRSRGGGEVVNPKQFLQIGGVVLLLVGILGFVGVIGPGADDSIFGKDWYFDNGENWAHTLIGVVGILASFVFPAAAQRGLVFIVGLAALYFGIYNLFDTKFFETNLENPLDTILHFVVGGWALLAASYNRAPMKAAM